MKKRKLTLNEDNYRSYLLTTYASWLGKIIGVRLGAPIENFTNQQIEQEYGEITGYPVDYNIFAADDDLNGPLFFVRALLDKTDITAEDVGETFLNYIQRYTGFFWWGGVGVSTEHTAYENLLKGMKAPESGSIKTNGLTMAEQIGGQIFSDCWGYVAGGNPERAKKLAEMASSVTHDGNGIQGGIFVAVAIALAYQENDIHQLLKDALEYLDKDMEYYRVANDIIRFYRENGDDWKKCLRYIHENYGYDRYPGTCHIIPNMALMIMAMCYGDNDFSRTLCMLAQSGWDTDCNCGNVGSIMGALVGIDNIDEKWIIPVRDIVNASSCVGCLNIQTASQSARMFATLAFKLNGIMIEDKDHFDLPYATEGFFSDGTAEPGIIGLAVRGRHLMKYGYYLGKDVDDARYDPVYSPIIYGGDKLMFNLDSPYEHEFRIFVQDCEGRRYYSDWETIIGRRTIEYSIPVEENMTVNLFGLETNSDEAYYVLIDWKIVPHNQLDVDFTCYKEDVYGPRWGGDDLINIRGFVPACGSWKLSEEGLTGEADTDGLITTGSIDSECTSLEADMRIMSGNNGYLVFGFKGYQHFNAIGIEDGKVILTVKNGQERRYHLAELPESKKDYYRLKVIMAFDKITMYINEWNMTAELPQISLKGACGFMCKGGQMLIKGFKLNSQFEIE